MDVAFTVTSSTCFWNPSLKPWDERFLLLYKKWREGPGVTVTRDWQLVNQWACGFMPQISLHLETWYDQDLCIQYDTTSSVYRGPDRKLLSNRPLQYKVTTWFLQRESRFKALKDWLCFSNLEGMSMFYAVWLVNGTQSKWASLQLIVKEISNMLYGEPENSMLCTKNQNFKVATEHNREPVKMSLMKVKCNNSCHRAGQLVRPGQVASWLFLFFLCSNWSNLHYHGF